MRAFQKRLKGPFSISWTLRNPEDRQCPEHLWATISILADKMMLMRCAGCIKDMDLHSILAQAAYTASFRWLRHPHLRPELGKHLHLELRVCQQEASEGHECRHCKGYCRCKTKQQPNQAHPKRRAPSLTQEEAPKEEGAASSNQARKDKATGSQP